MANTIKISDRMAEALTDSLATEDGQERRLAPWTRTGTCVALMDRGLLRYDRERTRENGYEVHTLTPLGRAMREWLESRPELRSFDLDVLKCGAEVMSAEREEAPAATEQIAPRPTMKRINVTPKMVEALENTIQINGKRAMIMSHPKTQAALVPRGLADEHGYLTDQGRFVAHLISLGAECRAWAWGTLEASTRTWLSDQKRHAAAAKPKTIKRVVNGRLVEMPARREAAKPKEVGDVMVPPADFRVAAPALEDVEFDSDEADREEARREASTVECECGAQWPTGIMGEGHNDMECTTASQRMTPTVTEYSVKIWYRSGAYQGAPHCPGELARKIFADAVESAGVEFAELHGPSGLLVESKTPNEERPVSTEPNENLFIAHLPQLPEPLPPAPLNVSQHGEDLTAAYSAQDPAEPTA